MTSSVSRRRALTGVATLGVGLPVLAACGDEGGDRASEVPSSSDTTSRSAATSDPAADPTSAATSDTAPGGLVAAADVPVGGGVILKDEELVVTQPAAGQFKAFSAICTHQGCLVGSVEDGSIHCPCHGSAFSASDGSVESGPAGSPLSAVAVSVVDGQVRLS